MSEDLRPALYRLLHGGIDASPSLDDYVITMDTQNGGNPRAVTLATLFALDRTVNLSQALTDQATLAWDVSLGSFATVTLAGNRTMGAPTNLIAGRLYHLLVTQDATGNRTITWNAIFKWAGGTAPTLSTAAGKIDLLRFVTDGTNLYGQAILDVR